MKWRLATGPLVLSLLATISCPSFDRVIRLPKVAKEYVDSATGNLQALRQKLSEANNVEEFRKAFDESALSFKELATQIRVKYYGKVQYDPRILFTKTLKDYPGKVSQFKLEFRLIVSEIQRITPAVSKVSSLEQSRIQESLKNWFQALDQINRP